ncbi:hypothetical protein LCGC14_1239920 [marine sediment metagenome]|uniref:Uncharacterized protein n=1 Tax=marine sediment metagenome TaxID=412755 RepID=A0A0F9L6B4_9ZZZZ
MNDQEIRTEIAILKEKHGTMVTQVAAIHKVLVENGLIKAVTLNTTFRKHTQWCERVIISSAIGIIILGIVVGTIWLIKNSGQG